MNKALQMCPSVQLKQIINEFKVTLFIWFEVLLPSQQLCHAERASSPNHTIFLCKLGHAVS